MKRGSPASWNRDDIEDEFPRRRVRRNARGKSAGSR